ncbi:hypothetical protein PENSPDRAFT_346108 [Peniophora sp. CONT]|nr:hypothetical protein PENSPDRAFT_346108 [Peniophora sp. CONT]
MGIYLLQEASPAAARICLPASCTEHHARQHARTNVAIGQLECGIVDFAFSFFIRFHHHRLTPWIGSFARKGARTGSLRRPRTTTRSWPSSGRSTLPSATAISAATRKACTKAVAVHSSPASSPVTRAATSSPRRHSSRPRDPM